MPLCFASPNPLVITIILPPLSLTFVNFSYKWYHVVNIYPSVSGLFRIMSSRFIHVTSGKIFFLRLNTIPLYAYTTVSSSTCPSMGTWVAPISWTVTNVSVNMGVQISLQDPDVKFLWIYVSFVGTDIHDLSDFVY